MSEDNKITVFDNKEIRKEWNEEEQDWYVSIVDVIEVLTESSNPQTYWRVMKKRLKDEGNETVTNCNALKMSESSKVAKQGGSVARAAREQYEKQSGKKVVTSLNAKNLKALKNSEGGDES